MISKQLAQILRRAMQVREESFDKAASDAAHKKLEVEPFAIVDFNSMYGLSLREAAAQACIELNDDDLSDLVYYLILTSWNDVSIWCDKVEGK